MKDVHIQPTEWEITDGPFYLGRVDRHFGRNNFYALCWSKDPSQGQGVWEKFFPTLEEAQTAIIRHHYPLPAY